MCLGRKEDIGQSWQLAKHQPNRHCQKRYLAISCSGREKATFTLDPNRAVRPHYGKQQRFECRELEFTV
jgi:hypothetical protein